MTDFTDDSEILPAVSGAYILIISLTRDVTLTLPRFAGLVLGPGKYAYVGSARGPGGIRARCRRHLKKHKSLHWHVDHLTTVASTVVVAAFPEGQECDLARSILSAASCRIPIPGFGSSDCHTCEAHLIELPPQPEVTNIAFNNDDRTDQAG
jgi:Uri superfamily endonuclease